MIVLIPSYEPDARLVALVQRLGHELPDVAVIVVDDGSGERFDGVFAQVRDAGADIVRYRRNQGKGYALRVGIRHAMAHHPGRAIVTADGDGQHRIDDIVAVGLRLVDSGVGAPSGGRSIVLGVRDFAGDVPARSRFGNAVSSTLFRLVAGIAVRDTQTGLRGYPAEALPWLLGVPGDRFEYEQSVLLRARSAGFGIAQVPIATVYLEHNASSHFRPVRDSLRVLAPVMAFIASSLSAFVIDAVLLFALMALTDSLVISVVGARLVSASVNFIVNRTVVFQAADGPWRRQLLGYAALAVVLLLASYGALDLLTGIGVPLLVAKPVADLGLTAVSWLVQQRAVFAHQASAGSADDPRQATTTPAALAVERMPAARPS